VSNLTQYKLFIGDGKSNTLFGVTSFKTMRFKGLTSFNEICFPCFTIRLNEFKWDKLHMSSLVIVTQKMFGYCGGPRAVSLFINRSAMFIEAVLKFTFGVS